MDPFGGSLNAGHLDPWTELGILFPDEYDGVYSVLVQPHVHFSPFPPRPAL